jgi:hypothetical protein
MATVIETNFSGDNGKNKNLRYLITDAAQKRVSFYNSDRSLPFFKVQDAIVRDLGLDFARYVREKSNLFVFEDDPQIGACIDEFFTISEVLDSPVFVFPTYFNKKLEEILDYSFPDREKAKKVFRSEVPSELEVAKSLFNGFNNDSLGFKYIDEGKTIGEVILREEIDQSLVEDIGLRLSVIHDMLLPSINHYSTLTYHNPFRESLNFLLKLGFFHNPCAFSDYIYEIKVDGWRDRGEFGSGFYGFSNEGQPIEIRNYVFNPNKPNLENYNKIKLTKGDKVKVGVFHGHGVGFDIPAGFAIEKLD